MSLRTLVYPRGRKFHTLTVCPCGYEFDEDERRWKHFLNEHDPEDFGLSPLGEIPSDHDKPLFGGEEP